MSYVTRMLKRASARLVETADGEKILKRAHPIWEITARGGKVSVETSHANKNDDKDDDKDDDSDVEDKAEHGEDGDEVMEVEVGDEVMEVEVSGPAMPGLLPLPKGLMDIIDAIGGDIGTGSTVMFVVGGRQFVGSVIETNGRTSVVQSGLKKYRVANDWLYKCL